ncbi:hypothetical protein SPI_08014 [Niveomyces insectorum RCEF 264]|uniref:Autophagy-related protein 16 domain-containing protein n=1 Tax=Niveomyces insectorum RCEF 264 TaxID=1081102 RepID=A0A167NQI7_9HYPO|nr:hypothetical protein SPI_08014 [Niveomyces insectorum RCEF 264]
MSDRRRVNFRESSPSNGTSSRYTSDSGLGSASDYPGSSTSSSRYSQPGGPGGAGGASGGMSQWNDLSALQEAYRNVLAAKDRYKDRARELQADLDESRKQQSEGEAKWRAVVDRNEQLEDENKRLAKENKALLESNENLQDEVISLREDLAEANSRFNELQRNVGPQFAAGTSPGNPGPIHGGVDRSPERKPSGILRTTKENKGSSSSTKAGSGSGSSGSNGSNNSHNSHGSNGSSSGSSSHSSGHSSGHSSSRAKVGSSSNSSSTSTAKISRQNSKHDSAKEQKIRLSQRFEHKNGGHADTHAPVSSSSAAVASSSPHKHHKSSGNGGGGSGANGSSGSNGSSASGESSSRSSRTRRQSYVEPFGPGGGPTSPNKGIPRSAPPLAGIPGANGQAAAAVPAGSVRYTHGPYSPPQPHYAVQPPYVSPRGDMAKVDVNGSIRPTVAIYDEVAVDPYHDDPAYYSFAATRDQRYVHR